MSYGLVLLLFLGACFGFNCAKLAADGPGGGSATGGAGRPDDGTPAAGAGGRGGPAIGVVERDGGFLTADVSTPDCTRVNIGILGNPGMNASSNFQRWLEARGTNVQRFQTTVDVPLTAEALKPFDVVILDWAPRNYTADEAAIFGAWVAAGGGVASMTGYDDNTTDDWRVNSLLSQLGLAYRGDRVWGPVMDFAANPITAGLTSVTFTGGYPVADLGSGTSTLTPLAFVSANGARVPVAYAVQMGTGHAFVWGDEWIEFDSEWSALPQIPKLWLQIFSWIAPGDRCTLIGIG